MRIYLLLICYSLIIIFKGLETLITKLLKSFHPNHFLMLSLKQKLLAIYRKEVATPNPKKQIIQRMSNICKEMYDVLEIVEPGISRMKGISNEIIYL